MKTVLHCAVALMMAAAGLPAGATIVTWTGGAGDGRYGSAGNWNPASVPGIPDTARFANGVSAAVAVDQPFTDTGQMLLEGGASVTLNLDAPLSLVASSGTALEVRGGAVLGVASGFFDSRRAVIGSEGSAGAVNLTGGSEWLLRGDLSVGGARLSAGAETRGSGVLTIAGASMRFFSSFNEMAIGATFGSVGRVEIGAGGRLDLPGILDVARGGGRGTLSIGAGGEAVSFATFLGNAVSEGTAEVVGIGSRWQTGKLEMQSSTLSVHAGAVVATTSAQVGKEVRASVDVSGAGSTWVVSGALNLDEPFRPSTGSVLTVGDGGVVTAGSVRVGQGCATPGCTPSVGSVFLHSGGELQVLGPLDVNRIGAITPNGIFIVGGTLTVTRLANLVHGAGGIEWRSGTLKVNGSGVEVGESSLVAATMALQAQQQLSVTGGPLTVAAGRSLSLGDGTVSVGFQDPAPKPGQLGVADGTVRITGGAVSSGFGVIGPDRKAAVVAVDGNSASWTNSGSLSLGSELPPGASGGQALLAVANGGRVDAGGRLSIADTGRVHLDGGTLAASAIVNDGGVIEGDGRLEGLVLNRDAFARLLPGFADIGALSLAGSLAFSGGALGIEIGGLASGEYDLVDIDGDASFTGGRILVHLVDGFLPQAGDVVPFLLSDTVSDFSGVSWLITGGIGEFEIRPIAGGRGLEFVALTQFIPEPGGLGLIAIGLATLAALRGRRRASRHPSPQPRSSSVTTCVVARS